MFSIVLRFSQNSKEHPRHPQTAHQQAKGMPERADPFSLLVYLIEKQWQCLVTCASFYLSFAKTMFLAASVDFQHKNFTGLSRWPEKVGSASTVLSTLPYGAAVWALFWQSTLPLLQSRGRFHGHEVVVTGGIPPLQGQRSPKNLPRCGNCSWGCFVGGNFWLWRAPMAFPGQVQRVVTALVTTIKLALRAPGQPGKCLEPCLVLWWQLLNIQAPKPSGCWGHPLFAVNPHDAPKHGSTGGGRTWRVLSPGAHPISLLCQGRASLKLELLNISLAVVGLCDHLPSRAPSHAQQDSPS